MSPAPHRIVAMDFGLIEALLTLGVTPLATSVPEWYRRTNVAPPLPAGVMDIGLLYQPNFEMLQQIRPDLFLITPAHRPLRPMLERIAPTLTLSMSEPRTNPYQRAREETMHLARVLGREAAGQTALQAIDAEIATARARVSRVSDSVRRPLFITEFADDRHLLVYGRMSLFGDVADQMGFTNGWHLPTNTRGYAITDFTRLAGVADSQLVYIEPLPDGARQTVDSGVLWHSLPFARGGRTHGMPKVSAGGALYTAGRFARQLADVISPDATHA